MDNYLDLLQNVPEEEQEQPIFTCDCCGDSIYIGETYFLLGKMFTVTTVFTKE